LKSAVIDIIEDKVMPFVEKNRENFVWVVSHNRYLIDNN
jgi:hypothetical protein